MIKTFTWESLLCRILTFISVVQLCCLHICSWMSISLSHQNIPVGANNKPKLPVVIAQCGEMWFILLWSHKTVYSYTLVYTCRTGSSLGNISSHLTAFIFCLKCSFKSFFSNCYPLTPIWFFFFFALLAAFDESINNLYIFIHVWKSLFNKSPESQSFNLVNVFTPRMQSEFYYAILHFVSVGRRHLKINIEDLP